MASTSTQKPKATKGGSTSSKNYSVSLSINPPRPDDTESNWIFRIPSLPPLPPPEKDPSTGVEKIWIKHLTLTESEFRLSHTLQQSNRVLSSDPVRDPPKNFILASFGNFQFREESPKFSRNYVERLLLSGITLNGVKYLFYGHSNSQLKSKSCYLLASPSVGLVANRIQGFGDFSNFNSVAKRAKRIGLLFTASESTVQLEPKRTKDVEDVEANGYNFTDGCGMINKWFAMQLAKARKIVFHDAKYYPSAFQIRYKGYKGMLMINLDLPVSERCQFRGSMKKFKSCPDNTFAVLNYSKPFTFGYLNGEIVTLLSALGIRNEIFIQKQNEYFDFLQQVAAGSSSSLTSIFQFLCYKEKTELAEKVLLQGLSSPRLLQQIRSLVKEEWSNMFKKKKGGGSGEPSSEERVRILIPQSRKLFGVCDYTGILKEGECFVRITNESSGHQTLDGAEIIVTRNPCLHPGDIRKFRAVESPQLNHLVDVIVFPIVGARDPASLMSGGDLDGDDFFVCWDKDLIPNIMFQPYGYPPAREVPQRNITHDDMIRYFAGWNNASLGKVKNTYLAWAKARRNAGCSECQELNKLFSSCVDGEGVKIPDHLINPPEEVEGQHREPWILDALVDNLKSRGPSILQQDIVQDLGNNDLQTDDLTEESLYEILTSKNLCLRDEYELFQLILRFCTQSGWDIDDLMAYFDFGSFTSLQKHGVLSSLENHGMLREQYLGPIFNGLYSSRLVSPRDLKQANLHDARVRWQLLYSTEDYGARRLYSSLEAGLGHFDKKLILAEVDEDEGLVIGLYIPLKLEIGDNPVDVGGGRKGGGKKKLDQIRKFPTIKLFLWHKTRGIFVPRSTFLGYKIKFDGEILQLYLHNLPNTFIWFALNEKYQIRNGMMAVKKNFKDRNGNNRKTVVNNAEPVGHYKFSIALQKFDQTLLSNHKRITKQPGGKFEIYVISNRDRVGHDLLDISQNQVDTLEEKKILENIPKEYELSLPGSGEEEVFWIFREFSEPLIKSGKGLEGLKGFSEMEQVLRICLQLKSKSKFYEGRLIQLFYDIFGQHNNFAVMLLSELDLSLLDDCCRSIPSLAFSVINFLNSLDDCKKLLQPTKLTILLLKSLLRSANRDPEPCRKAFHTLFNWITAPKQGKDSNESTPAAEPKVKFGIPLLIDLVKMILFSVRIPGLAKDFIATIFDPKHHSIFSSTGRGNSEIDEGRLTQLELSYALHFTQALAMDYLGELTSICPTDAWGVPIGAEDFGKDEINNKDKDEDKSRKPHLLSEFIPPQFTDHDENADKIIHGRNSFQQQSLTPSQINLNLSRSEEPGVWVTTLRTDIICTLRNEDHVRFVASKKANNAPRKGRLPVFDAIVKSIGSGKMEFVLVHGGAVEEVDFPEMTLATWNVYAGASTTNLTTELSAIMTLLERKGDATCAYSDILEMRSSERLWRLRLPPIKDVEFRDTTKFNPSQELAVREAVSGPVTLIWGPPGTGKTTVVVEIILQFLQVYAGLRILVTGSTHNAVDNILERFLAARKSLPQMHPDGSRNFAHSSDSDDTIRLASDLSKVKPSLKRWTLDAFVGKDLFSDKRDDKAKGAAMKKWKEGRIVFVTCSAAGVGVLRERNQTVTPFSIEGLVNEDELLLNPSSSKAKKRKKLQALQSFDVVIVDEASQITEPTALIPIVKSSNLVILVGDHVQLSPTVSENGKEFHLGKSLFEKLYTSTSSSSNCTSTKKVMLDTQYRMHPQLALYPSQAFYEAKLKSGLSEENRRLPTGSDFPWPAFPETASIPEIGDTGDSKLFPCVFVPCQSPENYHAGGGASKMNKGQIDMVIKIIKKLRSGGDGKDKEKCDKSVLKIAVLTPYAKQKVELGKSLKNLGSGFGGIEAHTIDGFQGREEDIIIFSTVRCNRHKDLGFLEDSRRINVAITRARFGLIIVGDKETLEGSPELKKLISEPFCKEVKLIGK